MALKRAGACALYDLEGHHEDTWYNRTRCDPSRCVRIPQSGSEHCAVEGDHRRRPGEQCCRRYHRRRAALVNARGRGLSPARQRLCRVRGPGLVLAGGNTIGTPGAVNQVKGTLVCGPGSASPIVIDTPLVPLDAQGNAEFSGSFSSSTAGCSPMDAAFLIRTAGGAWIGNGSVRLP